MRPASAGRARGYPTGAGADKEIPPGGPRGCQERPADFPAAAPPLNILGMSMLQIILLVALIALIAFWFIMKKKGGGA